MERGDAGLSLDPVAPRAFSAVSRGSEKEFYSPARYFDGSTGFEPLRSSKWSWGEETSPL